MLLSHSLLVGVVFGLAACSSRPPVPDEPLDDVPATKVFELAGRLDGGPVAERVVVWAGAPLFDAAAGAEAWAPPADAEPGPWDGVPMVVLADRGAAIEVESLSPSELAEQCAQRRPEVLEHYRLRLFAPRAALMPVVSKTCRVAYANDTWAVLRAGAPVAPTGRPNEYEVLGDASGTRFPLVLPRQALGVAFEASPRLDGPGSYDGRLAEGAPAYVNDIPVYEADEYDVGPFRELYDVEYRGEWAAATVHSAECVTLRVLVFPESVLEPSGLGIGGMGAGLRDYPHWRVARGTVAYWMDGREAGEVGRRAVIREDPPRRIGERLCFDWEVGRPPSPHADPYLLTVCHDAQDVVEVRSP